MATGQTSKVSQHLRRAALLQGGAGLSDGQLLGCFLEQRDGAAFAALVKRHGPLVWGVCRRLLGHHDAEDAFQATFLVLFHKAASVRPREFVANWLYGVAHRTALHARRAAARRRGRETQVTEMPEPAAVQTDLGCDLQAVLDQELSRLPDKYRLVIVLCDLEGRTRKEAARQLGWPEGTVAGRLARARGLLARRLTQQGVVLSGGALAAGLAPNAASACVPAAVVASTIQGAGLLAAGQAAADGLISARAVALTEGVLRTMLLNKHKAMAMALCVSALVALGGGLLTRQLAAGTEGKGEGLLTRNDKSGAKAPGARPQKEPRQVRYEDFVELNHGGDGPTSTGVREKGGFTVVALESAKGGSAFALSFAVKETELGGEPDFRVLAVDGNGKRHKARSQGLVSAGGNGIMVVTLLPKFDLKSENIKSFVIQRRVK